LNWYGVLGNRDYNNKYLEAYFYMSKHGWKIDDYFWSHKMKIGEETVAFVHIDTSFLAYGEEGEVISQHMGSHFRK